MKGRHPAPTVLKLLKGVRPARINKAEPKPQAVMGTMPKGWALHMSDTAKRFWKKNAPALAKIGLLTELDLEAFRAMAEIYSQWAHCVSIINRKGMTYKTPLGEERPRLEVNMVYKLWGRFKEYCQQFGMMPAERGRTSVPTKELEDDDLD